MLSKRGVGGAMRDKWRDKGVLSRTVTQWALEPGTLATRWAPVAIFGGGILSSPPPPPATHCIAK